MIPISVCRHHIFCVSASTGSYSRSLQLLGYVVPKRDQNKICLYVIPYTGVDTKLPHCKIPLQVPPRYLVA